MKNKSLGLTSEQKEEQFDRDLLRALLLKRWLIPQTPDEVRVAEAELEEAKSVVRKEMIAPHELLRGGWRSHSTLEYSPIKNQEIEAKLAWAARNGKEIETEVLERMRRDRAVAEGDDER